MAKFSGKIGYSETAETAPDVWKQQVIERPAFGDVLRNTRGLEFDDKVNPDFSVANRLSIVADEYANGHVFAMKYVWWRGARWVISDVTVEPPRLILRLGELYDGPTPSP